SQSNRARLAARNVQRAVDAWKTMSEHLLDGTRLDASWAALDRYASKVDEEIDLLVNYTAGDGFLYRQSARATVARDLQLNVAGTVLALLLSALVAWALSARIVGRSRQRPMWRSASRPASLMLPSRAGVPTNSETCWRPWVRCATISK